ncbi:hypothetical protein P280DRAFT_475825 [Massarina eburnea CBS 473.64]|uniref:Uncharacterized protein n=1 Tax=Massarina eburnea CBS 473.64 TaxID=1395130 RepID=A0A6A6SCE9_9PLEO|nr:hypothetical protein P280DRAFT_475825 [Massarina eburnea CBS 473.64]
MPAVDILKVTVQLTLLLRPRKAMVVPWSCLDYDAINVNPKDKIVSMVKEGAGVGLEARLTQSIEATSSSDDETYYRASRAYNSGSAPAGVNFSSSPTGGEGYFD